MSIPVDITFHPRWWNKNAGVSFDSFFLDPEYRIEADLKMRRTLFEKFGDLGFGERNPLPRPILGSDLIASGFLHSQILGCEIQFPPNDPPLVICQNLDEEGVYNLNITELENGSVWKQVCSQIDYLNNKFGYVESNINLMGVQNVALDIRGPDLFMDYYDNPDLANYLLKICAATSINIAAHLKKVSQ